ncbi:hypothetical protein [Erythrobacter cryptus]|uniref:hypothetical protein n=1 Tax=Erythrobacter cryptus TaxID=196588 RepID=UPI000413077D|nr:hypothetical protein [Erythrobacter cryptus]GIX20029.1 MAG: hypothetical protein KatS3mg120_1705 [Erythrobacter sp.]
MSRTLFENSKAALAFAGMTILGAVALVGPSDKGGVLPRLADRLAAEGAAGASEGRADAAAQGAGDQPQRDDPSPSVFGDYVPPSPAPAATAPARAAAPGNPMTAPLAPGATISSDSEPASALNTDPDMAVAP